jgi:hypothetical protein
MSGYIMKKLPSNLCYVGASQHDMVHLPVVVGGYGLKIWSVAVNILNKQSQQLIEGGPPAWRLGRG